MPYIHQRDKRITMEWTREPPKVAGWYWRRTEFSKFIKMVHVSESIYECKNQITYEGVPVGQFKGEWCGPIALPKEPKEEFVNA